MAETFSFLKTVLAPPSIASTPSPPEDFVEVARQRVLWMVWRMAIATWVLMAIGSATRVMNAGLACPDWPLCYGQLLPAAQMNLQVFLEWFHRLDAGLLGLSAIALVVQTLWQRQHLPRWVPWAAIAVLLTIVIQAALGAFTVTELLRFDIVTAHLGTALVLFALLLSMGALLMPYQGTGTVGKLPGISAIAAIIIYAQSLLGGLVGSQWALHQCLDLAHLCRVINAHLLGIIPTVGAIALWLIWAWRTPALHPILRRLRNGAAALLILQLLVGYGTFRLHLQVEWLTVTHQAIGAGLMGMALVFALLSGRDHPTRPSSLDWSA